MATGRLDRLLRSLAANVRTSRFRLGLTQEGLAERANVDLRFLQKIETATTNVSLDVLLRVADALHVKPGLLLRSATLARPRRGRPPSRRHTTTPKSKKSKTGARRPKPRK
jgi:transcriptional regulator with XRE-family HTH domain